MPILFGKFAIGCQGRYITSFAPFFLMVLVWVCLCCDCFLLHDSMVIEASVALQFFARESDRWSAYHIVTLYPAIRILVESSLYFSFSNSETIETAEAAPKSYLTLTEPNFKMTLFTHISLFLAFISLVLAISTQLDFAAAIKKTQSIQSGTNQKRDSVPSQYVASPYYPTPKGGWSPNWTASYAKAYAVVSNMTLAEKVNLTTGTGYSMGPCVGQTGSAPRFGIPNLCLQDSALGVADTDNVTAFPAGITVGASWNKALMYARGFALGQEARGKGVNIQLGWAFFHNYNLSEALDESSLDEEPRLKCEIQICSGIF